VLFREADGRAPFLDWFAGLVPKVKDKCTVKLERLRELGHDLRRPEADYLRDGIYELRVSRGQVQYFFHGNVSVVISHGLTKEREVPSTEIDLAIRRKARLESDPGSHTFTE
jgi:phage-related protein